MIIGRSTGHIGNNLDRKQTEHRDAIWLLFQCFSVLTIESSIECGLKGYFHGLLNILSRKFNKTHQIIQKMDRVVTENEIKFPLMNKRKIFEIATNEGLLNGQKQN